MISPAVGLTAFADMEFEEFKEHYLMAKAPQVWQFQIPVSVHV